MMYQQLVLIKVLKTALKPLESLLEILRTILKTLRTIQIFLEIIPKAWSMELRLKIFQAKIGMLKYLMVLNSLMIAVILLTMTYQHLVLMKIFLSILKMFQTILEVLLLKMMYRQLVLIKVLKTALKPLESLLEILRTILKTLRTIRIFLEILPKAWSIQMLSLMVLNPLMIAVILLTMTYQH